MLARRMSATDSNDWNRNREPGSISRTVRAYLKPRVGKPIPHIKVSCPHSSPLLRHDVFNVEQLSSTVSEASTNFTSDKRLGQSFYNRVDYVADRIADESEIRRGKQFPYQYFAAYLNADLEVPKNIRTSLHNAAEIACGNVPELPGPVVIGLDTSGSMSSAVTGHRGRGATSKSRCINVAALSCPDTELLNQSNLTGTSLDIQC